MTATTSCRAARLLPSVRSVLPEPLWKPPPCSQTMTGRRPSTPGVHTLATRQSSLMGVAAMANGPGREGAWIEGGP